MENYSTVSGWQELIIQYKSFKFLAAVITANFANHIWLEIYRLRYLNMLFKFLLKAFFQKELFSCLQKVYHMINYWPTRKGLFRLILTFILDGSFFLLLFMVFISLVYNVKILNCHFEIIFVFYGRCFQWMGRSSGCKPPVI